MAEDASPAPQKRLRVGVIGLDTSHVLAFTKAFQQAKPEDPNLSGFDVVAAYPFGSADIESSASRIPKYTDDMKALGVEIVDSIETLLTKVDCVLLETNDGRLHLEQALQVFRTGKPVFIDKPTGSNLAEVVAIFRAAAHYNAPMFSSSSLRYSDGAQAIRGGKVGRVLGCTTYSPCSLEPTHVDLFWYGIHGVESPLHLHGDRVSIGDAHLNERLRACGWDLGLMGELARFAAFEQVQKVMGASPSEKKESPRLDRMAAIALWSFKSQSSFEVQSHPLKQLKQSSCMHSCRQLPKARNKGERP